MLIKAIRQGKEVRGLENYYLLWFDDDMLLTPRKLQPVHQKSIDLTNTINKFALIVTFRKLSPIFASTSNKLLHSTNLSVH